MREKILYLYRGMLINRYLSDKGYEITSDKNNNGMYQCDIYLKGQYIRTSKLEFNTWEDAQFYTAKEMFNWFISKE